jgi:type II secretory pathway component GspD/PulD (secretin)/tetratricopeptide (TPR) repeat protein
MRLAPRALSPADDSLGKAFEPMQLRKILLPLLAAFPCSCHSNSAKQPAPDSKAAPEAQAAQPGAEGVVALPGAEPAAAGQGEAGQQPAQQPDLGADAQRLKRQQEQRSALSADYLKRGQSELERGDLNAALESFSSALELDPSSQAAREKMHTVRSLLGDSYADAALTIQDAASQTMVRRAQARLGAEEHKLAGENAMRAGDLDAAIEHFRQAQMILRYNPLIATDSLDEKIVTGELNQAMDMAQQHAQEQQRKAEETARAEKEKREAEEKNYRENVLRSLYTNANAAFLNEKFEKSEGYCDQILLIEPTNEAAKELRQIARDARHAKVEEGTRQNYREQWLRTMEEVDTMNVPQTDTLVFDDFKRWSEVSQRKPLEFSSLDTGTAADKQRVLDRLDAVSFAPRFETPEGGGSALADVAAYLQSITGVNFIITPKANTDLDEEQKTVKLKLDTQRSVRKVLDLIAETHENLRWKVEDGVVKFVTKDELKGGQVLRTYEVRDLIHPIPDFPGKEMNVSPSGGTNLPEEDKTEREFNIVSGDNLDTLIRNNVAVGSWDADPQNSLRITPSGTMVVHQTPEVHEQIQKLLEDLREATGIMVDIQARFLKVEDNFLEDIGVDFRGLGSPGLGTNNFFNDFGDPTAQADLGREIGQTTDLGAWYSTGMGVNDSLDARSRVEQLYDQGLGDDNVMRNDGGLSFQWTYLNDLQLQLILRAVCKSERVELVTSPRITVYNTARGNLAVLNQVAYVQDFNVEIAQGASIADPIVNVVQDGVVLDVRPVVSADRRFITLELRPTIATLKRPMREVVTTLGSQNSVTIQLPEVEYQRVRTSIPMPDGGTVLLGGMKVSDRQEMNSGVPILNKIPIVSFFFERKGTYISNRKLLVLLKASIVIPTEHEPTPAQVRPPVTQSH